MGNRISPTVRKRRLAIELRRLRDESGIKAAEVARELGCSPGKVSLMETGRVSITVPDTKAMLEIYGINGEQRDAFVELARHAKQRGWWVAYNDTMHPWFQQFVGLETETSVLRTYESEFIPGLLQSEDYQRALLAHEITPWTEEEVDQFIALRKDRQQILDGDTRFWFILNEAALRRWIGTPEVIHAQLKRLNDIGKQGNVTIQVLPFAAGAHSAMTGAFQLLEFPDPVDPDVIYVEHLVGARYLEEDHEVRAYRLAFEDLMASALSRTRSASLIREVMKEL